MKNTLTKMSEKKRFLLSLLLASALAGCGNSPPQAPSSEKSLHPRQDVKGRIVFQSNFDGDNEICMISGRKMTQLTDNTWDDEYPVWSPDGRTIAFSSNREGNFDIYLYSLDDSRITQLTFSEQDEMEPAWYPDGVHVAFTRDMGGFLRNKLGLFKINITSGRVEKMIPEYGSTHGIAAVSPADPLLTFTGKRRFGWDVAMFHMNTKKVEFLADSGKTCRARFSHDGAWLAFVSSETSERAEIWKMRPDGSEKIRLTTREDTHDYFPDWSPDDRTIVFNSSLQHSHEGDWQLLLLDTLTGQTHLLFDSKGNDIFADWHR
jgi:Tol biopolymer transport system component